MMEIILDNDTFALFDLTPDLVCIADKEGYFRRLNPAMIEKLGYTKEELFSQPIASFIHPEDKEYTASRRKKLLEGEPLLNLQNRYLTKKGGILWLEWTSIYIPDKSIVFAIAKDITARKLEEQAIEEKYQRFRELASHFKSSMENDKKILAVELHEGLAQLAAVVKMEIDWLKHHIINEDEQLKKRMQHANSVLDLMIRTIRKISFDVSPGMLEDLGLEEALKWLCNQFSNMHEVHCRVIFSADELVISHEMKLDIFRICQDALTHLVDHTAAEKISIFVTGDAHVTRLQLVDTGPGFQKIHDSQSAMRKIIVRAGSSNGVVKKIETPGPGSGVEVEFLSGI